MGIQSWPAIPTVLAFVTLWPVPTSADPITAVYDIHVVERRSSFATDSGVPIDQRFTLTLRFDPALGDPISVYGPPTFMPWPVPLDIPAAPENLPLSYSARTIHEYRPGFPDFAVSARAMLDASGADDTTSYDVFLSLSGYFYFDSPQPVLSPSTFVTHLGRAEQVGNRYNFQYSALLRSPGMESVAWYLGTATLREVEAPVIPEPTTLALVGAGLAIVARRRHRNRPFLRGDRGEGALWSP